MITLLSGNAVGWQEAGIFGSYRSRTYTINHEKPAICLFSTCPWSVRGDGKELPPNTTWGLQQSAPC